MLMVYILTPVILFLLIEIIRRWRIMENNANQRIDELRREDYEKELKKEDRMEYAIKLLEEIKNEISKN